MQHTLDSIMYKIIFFIISILLSISLVGIVVLNNAHILLNIYFQQVEVNITTNKSDEKFVLTKDLLYIPNIDTIDDTDEKSEDTIFNFSPDMTNEAKCKK